MNDHTIDNSRRRLKGRRSMESVRCVSRGWKAEDRKTHGGHEDSIMTSHNDDVDEDVPDSRSASEKNE